MRGAMEIPKSTAIGVIVLTVLIAAALYFFVVRQPSAASGDIPASAYPEYKPGERLPDSELMRGPEVGPPIAGSGKR